MNAKVVLDPKGLVLAPGELSRAPGALTAANNVNVEAPGIIRSRNGHAKETSGIGGPIWKMVSTKELGVALLTNHGTASTATGLKYGNGTDGWTSISGTYTNQPATRMQCSVGRRNHYVTTDEGVRRINSDLSTTFAGSPKGLGLDLAGPAAVLVRGLSYTTLTVAFTVGQTVTGAISGATGVIRAKQGTGTTGILYLSGITGTFGAENITDGAGGAAVSAGAITPGYLADTESVTYAVTWSVKDTQGVPMEGSPAARTTVFNNTRTSGWTSGAAQNVLARMPLPTQTLTATTGLTTSYYWRLYRSQSASTGITPSEDMNLVGEAFLTAGNISAGYVEYVDAVPEAFRALGPALYTNASLGGDDGVGGPGVQQSNDPPPRARDTVLFADCTFYSDLLYPAGLDLTLLSTVAGVGLTAGDTLTIGGVTYTAIAPGTPSNNQFQVFTVAGGSSLSEAVTRTAADLCRCINVSTTPSTVWAFPVSDPNGLPGGLRLESRTNATTFTAAASAHGDAFRPSIASAVSAIADSYPNGFAFSKPRAPDAVPRVNLGFLGRDDTSLLRSVVLGESIFMFSDAGLYRLIGRDFNSFAVQEFDLSFRLIGRELVAVCDDAIYAWGYQGIARITPAGVEYVSNAIEPLLLDIINTCSAITGSDAAQSAYTVLSKYAWMTAYQGRHKVVIGYPTQVTGTNKGNCTTALVYDTRMQAWTQWGFSRASDSDQTQGYSTSVARVFDDILYFGQWQGSAGDSYSYKERRSFAASDYKDDNYNQTNQAITKTLTWSAMASAPELETHWDELHVLFDVSPTFSAWTTPTALTVTFTADRAQSSSASSLSPTAASRMSRVLVAQSQRRSARLGVTVVHATASEYFGLEGLALVHLPGEGTATVRT